MAAAKRATRRTGNTGVVLSGGGARGAYQVGVIEGLIELGHLETDATRPDVYVGSSAGAINVGMLAAHANAPSEAVAALRRVWGGIEAKQVFRTDVRSLSGIGVKWAWDLTFGGAVGGVTPKSLLDTAPLRELLSASIPFEKIEAQVAGGNLHAVAIMATDLLSADGHVFLHGHPDIQLWERRRWVIERTRIGVEHLLASSAIPVFFPSVEVGDRHFGDGSVRNTAPLSPAINLGAERIIAVSVRGPGRARRPDENEAPTIAQIAGVLLDAVMLDAIEVDVEHSGRVNRSVVAYPTGDPGAPFRHVDVLWLRPSVDFTPIAAELAHRIPAIVRYLMRGLGSEAATSELMSYLLFDEEFCTRLMDLGRQDALAAREEIDAFFAG